MEDKLYFRPVDWRYVVRICNIPEAKPTIWSRIYFKWIMFWNRRSS